MCIIEELVNTQTISVSYLDNVSPLPFKIKVQLAVGIVLVLSKFLKFKMKSFGKEAEKTKKIFEALIIQICISLTFLTAKPKHHSPPPAKPLKIFS